MTKSQMKERALILISFAMIQEGFRLVDLDFEKIPLKEFEDHYDMKLVSLAKKLKRLNKMFATKKVVKFLDKRLAKVEDKLENGCQPLFIGLFLLYFYMRADVKKEIVISEIKPEDIKIMAYEHDKEYNISNCTIKKAEDIFKAIYPDEEGFIAFLKLRNKFPFNLKKEEK